MSSTSKLLYRNLCAHNSASGHPRDTVSELFKSVAISLKISPVPTHVVSLLCAWASVLQQLAYAKCKGRRTSS